LAQFRTSLAESAVSASTIEIQAAFASFMQALQRGRAVETASGKKFVNALVVTSLPQDGRPLPSIPAGCALISLPGMAPATAVSDPTRARVVRLEFGLSAALGAIQGERTRQSKEIWRSRRAANGGFARDTKHPSAAPDPPRPIPAGSNGDPDVRGSAASRAAV
jgi:hypothetical protein